MKLNYYLFKSSVTTFEQAIIASKLDGPDAYQEIPLRDVDFEAKAYLQRAKRTPPGWLTFIAPYCEIEDPFAIVNQSNSFLLLIRVNRRIFGVTTGYAFTAINKENLVADFGLRVTLNSVAVSGLRSLQARNVDANAVHKHIVTSRDSNVSVFDVDFYQDLLARMEGKPDDPALGARVDGADACSLISDVTFPNLAEKCQQLHTAYRRRVWKRKFPFFDMIRPVQDIAKINRLNQNLADAINHRDSARLSFALPDISQSGAIQSFVFKHPGCRKTTSDTLDADDVFAFLEQFDCQDVDVTQFKIVGFDEVNGGGNPVTGSLPLFRCAVFEVVRTNSVFILTLGKWYEVSNDYVQQINDRLTARAPTLVIDPTGYLPDIAPKESEGDYNVRAAQLHDYACMDKECAPIEGRSRIEVCDLFTDELHFIHVKRKTQSATLSHLFSQGTVSAECFIDHEPYRIFLNDQLVALGKNGIDVANPQANDYRMVYAVTAKPDLDLPGDLPFFSKVNLLHHLTNVERMGFKTGFSHIPIR